MKTDVPEPIKGPKPTPPKRKATNGRDREVYQSHPDGILKSVRAGTEPATSSGDAPQDLAISPGESIAAFKQNR